MLRAGQKVDRSAAFIVARQAQIVPQVKHAQEFLGSILKPEAPATPTPTFAVVAEEWLKKYPALHAIRHGTFENYRSFTEQHLIPFFGARRITDVTPTLIEDFIEAKRAPGGSVRRVGKPLSDASLRTGLLALRLILQRAVRTKLLPANPMIEVEWRGTPRIKTVDPFTVSEVQAILAAAEERDPDFESSKPPRSATASPSN